tara:strand:- start:109 stop:318 length:210 start_codon:yes stop_codon:yes gene_type:complete
MIKLNEKRIIELFQNRLGNTDFVPEDVESFKIGKKRLVVKVDTLVESTDLPPGNEAGGRGKEKHSVMCQ